MKIRDLLKKTIEYIFCGITIIQVVFGIIWIAKNFGQVYMWPETAEYLDIAWNYKIDEYVSMIYPILVKYLYYTPLYVVQIILALTSTYLFLWKSIKLEQNKAIIGTAYIFTFPMLLQFHLSIRPESLGLSVALFVITFLTYKKRDWRRYLCVFIALVVLLGVHKGIEEPGSRGRIQRTFWSAAFQRVCSDYFSQSFVAWDDRVITTFNIDEATELVKRSDNMMYVVGPALERDWGREGANECYKQMTTLCLSMRTRSVVENILFDLKEGALIPFSAICEQNKYVESQTGVNYRAFSVNMPKVAKYYWNFSIFSLILLLILGICKVITAKEIKDFLRSVSIDFVVVAVFSLCYEILRTGDAVNYSKLLFVMFGWCVLTVSLICNKPRNMVK